MDAPHQPIGGEYMASAKKTVGDHVVLSNVPRDLNLGLLTVPAGGVVTITARQLENETLARRVQRMIDLGVLTDVAAD